MNEMLANPYDQSQFFEYYQNMRKAELNLNDAVVNPWLDSVLPKSIQGKAVLDLGCGSGDLAKNLSKRGAREVVGVDNSVNMISEACRDKPPNCTFFCHDLTQLGDINETFDLAVSVMALHYIEDFGSLLSNLKHILKPGCDFLFAIEHPLFTSGYPGWVEDETGRLFYGVSDYLNNRQVMRSVGDTEYLVYHRSVESHVNELVKAGFHEIQLFPITYDPECHDLVGYRPSMYKIPVVLGVICRRAS